MKNIPLEEVRQNEWIRKNQGPKVGQSVVDLVEKMEDEVAVGEFVNKMVVNPLHSKHSLSANDYLVSWKNIFPLVFFFSFAILYFFQNVLKNLVKTMKTCLGDDFSSADEQAWVKLAGSLVPLFEAEIEKLPKKE